MKLVLFRHGQTKHNNDGIIQGWHDTDLTETGMLQIREAAQQLQKKPSYIISSDLHRALDSAQIIRMELGLDKVPLLQDWRLRERHFGTAEGQSKKDLDMDAFYTQDPDATTYESESENKFSERVWSFIQSLRLIDAETVFIVTHSGTLNRFGYLLDPDFTFIKYDNAATVSYDIDPLTVVNQLEQRGLS